MTRRPRLLFDTEVLLRAWRNDGPARELFQLAMVRDVSLCTSTSILDEFDDVLARPRFGASADERRQFRHAVLLAADRLTVFDEADAPRRSPDPGDDHVVEAALRTGSEIVVSQNKADLVYTGYDVLTAAEACAHLRNTGPFGSVQLLGVGDRAEQELALADLGGKPHDLRRGADVRMRDITDALDYQRYDETCRFAALSPDAAASLTTNVVRLAGRGLLVEFPGGNFDYVSGVWSDDPARGGAVPFDLIWYSSERAQVESIGDPEAPTIADWGWPDESRRRLLLAGALVVVLDFSGPFGEPDVRFIVLVGEPIAAVPEITNAYRTVDCRGGALRVLSRDPAGFVGSLSMSIAGGPAAIVFSAAPPPAAVDSAFRLSTEICRRLGWPTAAD